jgi:hypothetical protein
VALIAKRINSAARCILPGLLLRRTAGKERSSIAHLAKRITASTCALRLSISLPLGLIFINRPYFYFVLATIVANMIVLALVADLFSSEGRTVAVHINLALLCLFAADLLLRLLASGAGFFLKPWNLFDTIVFAVSIVGQAYLYGAFYQYSENGGAPSVWLCLSLSALVSHTHAGFGVLNAIRALRTFSILATVTRYRQFTTTFLFVLPTHLSMIVILFIVFYGYSIIGMEMVCLWCYLSLSLCANGVVDESDIRELGVGPADEL